jgi:hypothetical protein
MFLSVTIIAKEVPLPRCETFSTYCFGHARKNFYRTNKIILCGRASTELNTSPAPSIGLAANYHWPLTIREYRD